MTTSTRPGDVLAGRYRLIDLLSESGGGRFWRAHDNVLERFVALHVIGVDDPRAAGLIAAARTSAGVLDPRILRVLDAEQEDDRCFVVNEWGTGISLDILVTHAGPLGPRRSAWLVADVAEAIARAHAAGVTHGRLNPENILIDRYGSVRIIGLCVDAALHGLQPGDVAGDLEDLGGLLYCSLTGLWPGPSGSIVPAAPRDAGSFFSPRQVRAGVPKPLDLLWREFECTIDHGHRRRRAQDHPDVTSAQGIAEELLAFVGDPAGMPEALAQSIPAINELRPVWLPALADPLPHDSSLDDIPVVPPAPHPAVPEETEEPPIPSVTDLPTEAGMPVFGDDEDDVQWLRTRASPTPPPPPFEDPPERPLFAPDPPDGVRRPRPGFEQSAFSSSGDVPPPVAGFWPWDTDAGPGADDDTDPDAEAVVPGRSWLRLAMAVGGALLLLMAVAVAFNLGRGRTPLGGETAEDPPTSPTSAPTQVISPITPSDFDPLGDGAEHPDKVGNIVDSDAETVWTTQGYNDQLGAPPFKPGVGLVLDLGEIRQISSVELQLGPGEHTIELYASTNAPGQAPDGDPAAQATGSDRLVLAPTAAANGATTLRGRYLVLWWTSLPEADDGFRAQLAEVVVRGE